MQCSVVAAPNCCCGFCATTAVFAPLLLMLCVPPHVPVLYTYAPTPLHTHTLPQHYREKNSAKVERMVQFAGTSQMAGLPPYLTVQMMRFFFKRTPDGGQKAKILRKVSVCGCGCLGACSCGGVWCAADVVLCCVLCHAVRAGGRRRWLTTQNQPGCRCVCLHAPQGGQRPHQNPLCLCFRVCCCHACMPAGGFPSRARRV